ncbi:UDP:flavonoid glycosyltransferase YjiC (YdhE family) [Geodermatophilus bullaregiensis]|uniref:glycosyltransferase n=1 Tax=Geodermatophilus bullaregiensis TaxID=1564160 RepID=UPI0019560C91|nr:glycosyltransferase [Geodermatophilus bullaregiensis]MBM7809100.1 UDP:flavonoid glycosyltransferase YjiC (YdhE family) [Geodermatophilus bullaregiensis]
MRALFVASPMVGHVLPLVPLALAFRDAGHDVLVATAEDGVGAARGVGVAVRDVAPGLDVQRTLLRALLPHPIRMRHVLAGDDGTASLGCTFAPLAERMTERTVALADAWRPGLVLHEGLAPLGALVAARLGVPAVLVDALVFDGRELSSAVTPRLAGLARRYGVDAIPGPADAVVAVPASLVGRRRGRPMRYVPAPRGGDGHTSLPTSGTRPVVLVSRSTVADPRPDRMTPRVVAAARGAEVDVVLVRPARRVARRPLPANVTVTGWVPFADVLPRVAGMVHHGGAGSVLSALAAGVPQVVVPGAGDRTVHARLVAARGAGLAVPAREITTATLERVVGDPVLRRNAQEVAAEIAAMPPPADLVEPLVALAR